MTVPAPHRVAIALDRLPIPDAWVTDAAVHLALPVTDTVGPSAWLEDGVWTYRDAQVADDPDDPVGTAVRLARAGHRPGDQYLDLEGNDPVAWCKPLGSGARTVLFGADLLLGAPAVAADADVSHDAIREVLRCWLDDDTFRPPTVMVADGQPVLVAGTDRWLLLRTG